MACEQMVCGDGCLRVLKSGVLEALVLDTRLRGFFVKGALSAAVLRKCDDGAVFIRAAI